jgi:hypothetical protein
MRSIKDKFEYTKGVISNVNRKMTDNTVAKGQWCIKHYTEIKGERCLWNLIQYVYIIIKGNNKITELRTILQRKSHISFVRHVNKLILMISLPNHEKKYSNNYTFVHLKCKMLLPFVNRWRACSTTTLRIT